MPHSIAQSSAARHRVISEIEPRMAKVAASALPKSENREYLERIGGCLDAARREIGWTVDQLAAELQRDPKQVGRWMRGEERTQVDAVFAVKLLQQPFVIALAKLAAMPIEVTIRRTA